VCTVARERNDGIKRNGNETLGLSKDLQNTEG
jgi:hypothetical protein